MKIWLIFYRDRWGRIHRLTINSQGRRDIALKMIERSNPKLTFIAEFVVEVPE